MSTQGLSGGAFDFDTQEGIAQLLASARAANISTEEKNDLRDTIFLYINGGRDQTVRISLEQKLQSLGINPVAPLIQTNNNHSPMAFSRSTPNAFSVSKPIPSPVVSQKPVADSPTQPPTPTPSPAPAQPATVPTPVQPQSASQISTQPAPAAIPTTSPASVSAASTQQPAPPVAPAPQPPSVPVTAQTPQPTSPPSQSKTPAPPSAAPTPVQPQPSVQSVPQSATQPIGRSAPAAAPTVSTNSAPADQVLPQDANVIVPGLSPDVYLNRIKEIKSLVNQKVGNPVNLVDIDNEVGREYMGALLDAMKKINSGASAVSAMKRLEDAFVSVEKAISAHESKQSVSAPASSSAHAPPSAPVVTTPKPVQPQPSTPTPPVAQPVPNPGPAVQSQPISQPRPAPVQTTPIAPIPKPIQPSTPSPVPQTKPVSAPVPQPETDFDDSSSVNKVTIKPQLSNQTSEEVEVLEKNDPVEPPNQPVSRVPIQDIPDMGAPRAEQDDGRWSKSDTPVPVPEPKNDAPTVPKSDSPTSQKTDAGKPADNKGDHADDPLYAPEIDDGLNQLLSEWSLFKKSGLFGTGPKGREHPLFKKVANLQIPLLLAGRFEGATQEIKQSITDYMNGWRYEQGIVYNQGETFERYLRRVIKHILDLQKKKTPA